MSSNVASQLKLSEFKALYKVWKTNIPWVDHLLLGLLVWLEEKLIDNRVKVELDEAIEEWGDIVPPLPDMVTPEYTETPGDNSLGVSEIRLTAPWYADTYGEK